MKLGMDFTQRLSQTQQLAPHMIQSMAILQMPLADLQERLDQELEDNPFMELKQKKDAETPDEAPKDDDFDPNAPLVHDENNESDFQRLDALDRELDGHFSEEHRFSRSALEEMGDRKLEAMSNMPDRPQSLEDFLQEQISFFELSEEQKDLLNFLISSIDERGYLRESPEMLIRGYDQPVTDDELEDALDVLHKLDPIGIGARDLRECLLLQITRETEHRDLVRLLIQNHLEDIQFNRLGIVETATGYPLSTIREAIAELRKFNPRPGAEFVVASTHYVVPDLKVEKDESTGEYSVRLTDDWMPEVHIPQRFVQLVKDRGNDSSVRKFIKGKLQAATWLRDAIEQRRNTLKRVAEEIIAHQRAFFEKGPDFIEPLKMQQIADKIEVHVTTVSRAVDNKWMETPRGVFPLKRFFGGGTRNEITGEDVAWETIRRKLLDFIGEEDKANPLSDEDLVEQFKTAGLDVKRRTVTKYRKLLNIPSSRERKL